MSKSTASRGLYAPRTSRRYSPRLDPETVGRITESIARFFGTGRYLLLQTILVVVWIALNLYAVELRWDPYPFILLNLCFSTQAAYAAPMILLAQNRQADRDRAEVERDRETNARSLADTEYLAREMAGIRLSLERKADREDVTEALERLTRAIERSYGLVQMPYSGGEDRESELEEPQDE